MNKIIVDRTQKENVSYICCNNNTKASLNKEVDLSDMYNFIKEDLYLAEFNQLQEEEEEEFDIEGFPIAQVKEVNKEIGFLGQDLITSTNPVVNLVLNGEQARKQNTALVCNQDNYINVIAGALKQAILKIEELEEKIQELEKEDK